MERKPKRIEKSEAKAFFVYCQACDKILYEASGDNDITRRVAENTAISHYQAFSDGKHQPVIIPLKIYQPN